MTRVAVKFKKLPIDFLFVINMKGRETNAGPAAVGFVGSILFIVTLVALWGTISSWSITTAFWPTLVAGIAIIATIALFIASIGNMSGHMMAAMAAMKAGVVAALALVVLTLNSATALWLVVTVVGFVLTFLGTAMSFKNKK